MCRRQRTRRERPFYYDMQMEAFYAETKDADCLIYNSTIDGELQTLDELLQKIRFWLILRQ